MGILKKSLSCILGTLFIGTGIGFSLANDIINFNIQPEFGLIHGSVSEYVYEDKITNTDNLESRLDWDLPALPYLGATAEINLFKVLFLGFNTKYIFPGNSGYMQDYDWLNSVPPRDRFDWRFDDPTELTNYSKHDNYLNNYYIFSIELGGTIPIKKLVFITPVISYEYSYLMFTGSDGFASYKYYNFEEKSFEGDVISYGQETNILKFGIKSKIIPVSFLTIGTDFYYSPMLSYVYSLDKHFIGKKAFLDKMNYASVLQAKISMTYNFKKFHKVGLTCGFEYMPIVKGDDYTKPLDDNNEPSKKTTWGYPTGALGGTSHYRWNWGLIYSFNF